MQFLTKPSACSGRELVDGSVVVFAPVHRGAVKVSKCVDHHPIVGETAIGRALERMNNSFRPLARANGTQLKNRATAQTAFTGRSIKIASYVKNKITNGTVAVRSLLEAVKYLLGPFADRLWGELVNRANSVIPTIVSRPVDIAWRSKAALRTENYRPVDP